jgi:hypothetical protein
MSHRVDETTKPWLTEEPGRKPVPASPLAAGARAAAPVNLAIYDGEEPNEVVNRVLQMAQKSYAALQNQREALLERWEKADSFYWMAQKEHRMPELTRAKVSASIFYQAVRRLANGANVATFPTGSDKLPVKAVVKANPYDLTEKRAEKAKKAEAVNQFALFCFQKADIETKRSGCYTSTYKYANFLAYTPWDFEIERRKRWEPANPNRPMVGEDGQTLYVHADTGETSATPHGIELREVEYDYVCKDSVGFYPLPIEDVWLDDNIADLDRQPSLLWRSSLTRAEIWKQAKAGLYANTDKITETHAYDYYSEQAQTTQQRRADAGKATASQEQTELYERWQCWMLLPRIEVKKRADGTVRSLAWDQNAEPRRYLLEVVGNVNERPVIVRLCESPYWDNGVPFIDAHSHDDDCGFYRRGLTELLDDNMVQEQVAKGQLMDNRTLMSFRPLVRQIGRVRNKSLKITHNTVFDVTHPDAIKQLDVRDNTATILPSIQYIRDDSEKVANTPKFMLGDAMGGRTTASEFASIRDSSAAPSLNDYKQLNLQIWGRYLKKIMAYMPQFLSNDISAGDLHFTPDEFNDLDFDVEEVATNEFENRMAAQQVVISLVGALQSPMFVGIVNPVSTAVKIFSQFPAVFPNPEELIVKNPATAALLAEWRNQAMAVQKAVAPGAAPSAGPDSPPTVTPGAPNLAPSGGPPVAPDATGAIGGGVGGIFAAAAPVGAPPA